MTSLISQSLTTTIQTGLNSSGVGMQRRMLDLALGLLEGTSFVLRFRQINI